MPDDDVHCRFKDTLCVIGAHDDAVPEDLLQVVMAFTTVQWRHPTLEIFSVVLPNHGLCLRDVLWLVSRRHVVVSRQVLKSSQLCVASRVSWSLWLVAISQKFP